MGMTQDKINRLALRLAGIRMDPAGRWQAAADAMVDDSGLDKDDQWRAMNLALEIKVRKAREAEALAEAANAAAERSRAEIDLFNRAIAEGLDPDGTFGEAIDFMAARGDPLAATRSVTFWGVISPTPFRIAVLSRALPADRSVGTSRSGRSRRR